MQNLNEKREEEGASASLVRCCKDHASHMVEEPLPLSFPSLPPHRAGLDGC